MINYKEVNEDGNIELKSIIEDRSNDDDQLEEKYNVQDKYLSTIDFIQDGFENEDYNQVHEQLLSYRMQIEQNGRKIPIEELRLPDVIQILMNGLHQYLSGEFNQIFVSSIFHTFNYIFQYNEISHPFQLFTDNNLLFNILIEITGKSEDSLLFEIINFLYLILDDSEECMKLVYSVINLSIFRDLINPEEDQFSSETFKNYVLLINALSLHQNEVIENLEVNLFFNAVMFVQFGLIEAQKTAFTIVDNLVKKDYKTDNLKNAIEESAEFSQSVERLLNFETEIETLSEIIKALGRMCLKDFDLNIYNLNLLIQFLDYDLNENQANNELILTLTSFALCNALKDANRDHFSDDDCLLIFNKLWEKMEDCSYNISSYIGGIIIKIFRVIPNQYYPDFVRNGFFNLLQKIASADTVLIKNTDAFFDTIDYLFTYADENQLFDEFANAFVDSDCRETLSEMEFSDDVKNVDDIRERIGSLLSQFDQRFES